MAVIHGSWIVQPEDSYLFVWGEIWRHSPLTKSSEGQELELDATGVAFHRLAMTREELTSFLRSRHLGIDNACTDSNASYRWQTVAIALPTPVLETEAPSAPVYSELLWETNSLYLHPWQVEGLCLSPMTAMKFLQKLPLGSLEVSDTYVGADLRFWSHVCRWSLDILARCKFLPSIQSNLDGSITARWQPLLDSAVDRSRLEKFASLMPLACWGGGERGRGGEGERGRLSTQEPEELLLGFLSSTVDALVRTWSNSPPLPATEPLVRDWLQTCVSTDPRFLIAEKEEDGQTQNSSTSHSAINVEHLEAALKAWTLPVQTYLVVSSQNFGQNQFRTCFALQPPMFGDANWTLEYLLQADNNSEFLVDAKTIWNHSAESLVYQNRTIAHPQETFLRGLGLASRLYPPIEPSLHDRYPQFCRLTPVQAYEFIKASAWRLQDSGLGVVLPPSLRSDKAGSRRLGLKIRSGTTQALGQVGLQSLLKFEWELSIGDRSISKQEFERLVALKTPFVEVNDEWIALQPQDIKAAEAFLATPKPQLALSLEDALRLSKGDTKTVEKLPIVSFEAAGPLQELLANLSDNKTIEAIAPPANFRGQLRPYQARGVGWLTFLERWGLGSCLADDMGLGKTVQYIAFLLHLQEQKKLEQPTLLVCPTSVLGNWEREVKKFGPTLKVLVHHGDKRAKDKAFAKVVKGKDLIVTSYPLVFRDAKTLQSISWRGVVLDEAQNIKNAESKQSQAVRQLQAGFRIALTGTPVENRLSELWSILDFLNPGYLGTRQFFQRRFAMPIEKYGDRDSLQSLRSLVQPFILRRVKTDREIIQDLPEKQEMNVFCGLSAEQAALYQKLVDESLAEIEDAEGIKRRGMILTLLLRLKQICNHPAQYLKENTLGSNNRSGKLQRCEEMLEEAISEGDRALIFTQFAECGKLLKPHLEQRLGCETLFLYGGTRKKQREEMIDRFQQDPQGPPILILSLKAGGTGLNLTRANHVFHFDRWWNPAVENQATDRVFRIGQTRNVQVHKFICTGTLEERINEMIDSKKQLAEQTVDAGEQWLTEMDTDRLRNLLMLDRTAVIDDEG